ncbi:MAG TPA: hypothetical protein VHU17_14870, partial [Acidimicrobiales bacterium]|nr:hypothetical protein [Acidimicrobiales bacterium]
MTSLIAIRDRIAEIRPRSRTGLKTVVVASLYAIVAIAVYWDVWSTSPRSVTQLGGDQYGTVWFLQWVPFAMVHGHNPLFTNYANFPHGVNLLDNTSVPLLGAAGAPLTWIWGPIATYNFWCTAAFAGSALAAYVFVHRLVVWRPVAFIAGLVYGFSPYEIGHSGHLNLSFVVFPPLILLCLYELVVKQSGSARRWGILLGLLVTAQFFVSIEVLVSTAVMAGICLIAVAVIGHRSVGARLGFAGTGALWGFCVAAVLLAYPVWFVFRGPGYISGPIQLIPQAYRASLLAPIIPGLHQWLSTPGLVRRSSLFASSTSENGSYLGVALLATLVIGAVYLWRKSSMARVATIGCASAFVLSLGAGLVVSGKPSAFVTTMPLPERLFTHLPLFSNTVPVRYSLYVVLFAAILLALVVDELHRRLQHRRLQLSPHPRNASLMGVRSWVVPGALVVACLLPLVPALPVSPIGPVGIPTYFTSSSSSRIPPDSVALVYPFATATVPSAVLWQAETNMRFKMPGGYFLVSSGPRHRTAYNATLQ